MTALLWWSGITWDTSMRQIGWAWVALVVFSVLAIRACWKLYRLFRPEADQ